MGKDFHRCCYLKFIVRSILLQNIKNCNNVHEIHAVVHKMRSKISQYETSFTKKIIAKFCHSMRAIRCNLINVSVHYLLFLLALVLVNIDDDSVLSAFN